MRKTRRKIRRRKKERGKGKSKRRKSWLIKHIDAPVTNRFTKIHAYLILITEILFLAVCSYWAYFEIFVRAY